jgi:hypothetical protein
VTRLRFVRFLPMLAAAVLLLPAAPANAAPADHGGQPRFPFLAVIRPIDPHTAADMTGKSWKPGCPVPLSDLRIINMTFWGFDDRPHFGELVVHREVARGVVTAFRTMYEAKFPIRRMERVDVYGADDDLSMAADNTSAFNCRNVTGTTDRWSIHSYGKAIDINTIENPYVSGTLVLPPAGAAFLDRADVRPGMITHGDLVWRAFERIEFVWGGDWTRPIDYQHFETAVDPRPPAA